MTTFTDTAGRTWTVALNHTAIKRVRGLAEVDLLSSDLAEVVKRLLADPVTLCDVIYAVCKPDADAANVTDEEFGRAMAGDAIDLATRALLEELVNFTPNPRDRERLRRVIAATWKLIERTQDALDERTTDEALDRAVAAAAAATVAEIEAKTAGGSSTNSPGSSG